MSQSVTFNSSSYTIPDTGDSNWGSNVTNYLVAISTGCLQKSGGSFTLTAEVDFGGSFGLKATSYKSRTANIATAGTVRLANNSDSISWRNAANNANLALLVDGSNQLTFNGSALVIGGYVSSITGTANQVIASASTGAVTLSTPQSIGTASTPTFGGLTLSSPLTVANGGSGDASHTAYSVLCGGTTSTAAVQSVASVGTSGQVLTSNGAAALPTWQSAGTGTVNSGTATHLAYYATSAAAVSDASTATITGSYTFSGGAGALTMSSSTIAMGANKITGLANGTASTDAAAYGQLKVLQTVTFSTVSATSTTSSTYQATSVTASITPTSASNRVLIMVSCLLGPTGSPASFGVVTVKRGSTDIGPAGGFATSQLTSGLFNVASFVFVDSPSTTSSTAYTVNLKSNDNTSGWQVGGNNTDSTIVLMEVV